MKASIVAIAMAASALAVQADDVRWLQTTHDFGAFSEDENQVSAQFRFVNDSAEPVSIVQVASTCGCTVPQYSADEIAPGDTATIDVTYNAVGRPGRFAKQVYVRTSNSHERYKLTIKGVVIGNAGSIDSRYPMSVGPLRLRTGAAMLGRVAANATKAEYVEAYNQSSDTIAPIFGNLPKYLTVRVSPDSIPPGELATLNFFFTGSECPDYGIVSDSITIKPTIDAEEVYFPFVAIVEEDFSKLTDQERNDAPRMVIDTDRIDLGQVPINATEPITVKIQIRNKGKNPLKIRRTYSQDPNVTATAARNEVKKDKSTDLIVTFDPSSDPTGIINTRFTIITNDPEQSTKTLRIVGTRK